MKRNNKRTRKGRRGGNRSRPSEGLGRKSSVIISNSVEIPTGLSGATFTVEELLRNYFKEERLIKIYKIRVKMQPLNAQSPYYQVQGLVTLDEPGSALVALTHVIQGGIYSKNMSIVIAQPRRFWVLDKRDDFKFLDLRFQSFADHKLMIEIETYFHIEIDELTPLAAKQITLYDDDNNDSEDGSLLDKFNEILVVNSRPPTTSTKIRKIESLPKK